MFYLGGTHNLHLVKFPPQKTKDGTLHRRFIPPIISYLKHKVPSPLACFASAFVFGLSLLSSSGLDKSSLFHPRYYHGTEKGPELKK
jgi:hypothetical protein